MCVNLLCWLYAGYVIFSGKDKIPMIANFNKNLLISPKKKKDSLSVLDISDQLSLQNQSKNFSGRSKRDQPTLSVRD